MNVLFGPSDPAGIASGMAKGLRRRGHNADVVLFERHPFGMPCDRIAGTYAKRALEGLHAPFRYDVLHYQFGTSFAEFLDTAWSRLARRPLALVQFSGDDCRRREICFRLHPARARVFDKSPRDEKTLIRRLRLGGRFCAGAVVQDLELASYVEEFFRSTYVVPAPVDLHVNAVPDLPTLEGKGAIVFHAPSNPAIKGTHAILECLEGLAASQPLRIRTVSGVPRSEVLAEIARADIVIDQLNSETSGVFALEAMGLGKPTLLEFRQDRLAPFQQQCPLVRVTAETLPRVVQELCADATRRTQLGTDGRAYVQRTHSVDRVALALEALYEHARLHQRGLFEVTAEGVRPIRSTLR